MFAIVSPRDKFDENDKEACCENGTTAWASLWSAKLYLFFGQSHVTERLTLAISKSKLWRDQYPWDRLSLPPSSRLQARLFLHHVRSCASHARCRMLSVSCVAWFPPIDWPTPCRRHELNSTALAEVCAGTRLENVLAKDPLQEWVCEIKLYVFWWSVIILSSKVI